MPSHHTSACIGGVCMCSAGVWLTYLMGRVDCCLKQVVDLVDQARHLAVQTHMHALHLTVLCE